MQELDKIVACYYEGTHKIAIILDEYKETLYHLDMKSGAIRPYTDMGEFVEELMELMRKNEIVSMDKEFEDIVHTYVVDEYLNIVG